MAKSITNLLSDSAQPKGRHPKWNSQQQALLRIHTVFPIILAEPMAQQEPFAYGKGSKFFWYVQKKVRFWRYLSWIGLVYS